MVKQVTAMCMLYKCVLASLIVVHARLKLFGLTLWSCENNSDICSSSNCLLYSPDDSNAQRSDPAEVTCYDGVVWRS